ncbi:MAG TPA: PAS domain S-box protein, partial [Chloroflexia bacterium]|nr:PAS domain S-box protein [Chloroflexia bacterium]
MMSASFSDKFESLPELFSSDSQILNFFESIGEAFIFLNPTGKIVYLNSLAESLLKRPRRELLGQDIWQEFQEAVTTRFYEELQRARVTNRTVLFDEFYPPLDCWFAVRAVPSKAGLLVYFQNITAQKKLEQQLQELHPGFLPQQSAPKKPFPTVSMLDMDLQAVVVRRMAEGVCLIKASSNTIVYANPKFEQMFGYNPGELLGQPFSVLYNPNSESDASKIVQEVINRLYVESEFTFEVCNARKDGSLFWTSSTASIFEHPVYETLYVIVHQDINTRKQIEAALYESEERYRLVVQALTEGIVIQDTGGRIITCNSSAEGILGLSLDQLLGRTSVDPRWRAVREDGKPFPGLEHPAMQTLLTGQPMTNVIMGIHKPSGELSWISVNTQPVFKPGPSKKEKSPIAVVSSFTDITERLKAEQAVRESEERFSRMFLAAPTPLVLTTYLDTSVLDANSQFCALIGFSTEELIGQNLFNLLKISPEIANTWKEQLHLVGNVFNHEISVYNSQNTLIWLLASLNLVEIDSRPCILSTFIDISERKRLEIALSNSEELYRVMARNLPESAVLIFDRDLRFVLAEGNALEKSGFTSEVVEGKTLWEVLQPEDAAKLLPYYEAALSGIEHHFEDYYDDRVYLVQALPLKNEKGEIFAGMFLSQDISRLKQAELRATTEKERLDVTLRSIGDGVIATDLAGNITLINSSAEKLTGWESQEASGLPIETVFNITNEKTREIVPNPVRKTLEEGKVIELSNHTVLTNKKGNAYSIADSSAPIRDRNGKIIGSVLVFRDVTERQKLAEEMIRASKLESLGVLAGGIAHDFNNLLTAIIGNLDLAQQYSRTIPAAANSENLKTSLEEVSKAVVRSKDLTLQLLTFARGGAPVKKTTQLETVVRDAANFAL